MLEFFVKMRFVVTIKKVPTAVLQNRLLPALQDRELMRFANTCKLFQKEVREMKTWVQRGIDRYGIDLRQKIWIDHNGRSFDVSHNPKFNLYAHISNPQVRAYRAYLYGVRQGPAIYANLLRICSITSACAWFIQLQECASSKGEIARRYLRRPDLINDFANQEEFFKKSNSASAEVCTIGSELILMAESVAMCAAFHICRSRDLAFGQDRVYNRVYAIAGAILLIQGIIAMESGEEDSRPIEFTGAFLTTKGLVLMTRGLSSSRAMSDLLGRGSGWLHALPIRSTAAYNRRVRPLCERISQSISSIAGRIERVAINALTSIFKPFV